MSVFAYAKRAPFLDDAFFTRSVEPDVLKTLASAEYQKRAASDPDLPKLPGFLETAKRNLKRLADGGVKFGFGTDTGPPARFSGYFEHLEMELMAQAGLTPMQIITAASASSAEYLGASKDIGTLEAGRWGDLVVLARSPLADIKNTRSIEAVYISGIKVR
jgi:imidazolonepropionase-like amidohydrolase